jgi:hypothetical protein
MQFALFLILCPVSVLAADIELEWDASTGPNLAGYKVYYGTSPHVYSASIATGKQTTCTLRSLPAGTWYFAVTAYDAQGKESGFSNEVSTTIAADGLLTITAVDAADVTTSSAVVVWTTSGYSDSQVEYGTTTAYGRSTALNSSMVTAHSQTLSRLAPNTLYHYRVKSRDAAGNYAVSGDFIFGTPETPRFKWLAENETTSLSLPLFRAGAIREETGEDDYTAAALVHSDRQQATSIIFPEIGIAGKTQIIAANTDPTDAILSFELVGADGTAGSSVTRSVRGNGALIANMSDAFFGGVAPSVTDYVRVRATEGVRIMGLSKGSSFGIALQGQDANGGATTLYAPQYAAGNGEICVLSIVNLDSSPGNVTLNLVPDGSPQIEVIRTFPISPNGKIYIDDPEFFQTYALGKEIQGYVEIVSDGIRLAGTAVFSDVNPPASVSALPLVYRLQNSLFFNNAFSSDLSITGMLVLNPGGYDAYLNIDVYSPEGSLVTSATDVVAAKQRVFHSLKQYFPALTEQNWTSGYIRIVSDMPIAAFAQLESGDLSFLSEMPPQEVR